jgi:hypothetical protein
MCICKNGNVHLKKMGGGFFCVPVKDGATGARRRVGMRAHYSANTQQVEREGESSRGRQM